jgi:plasmid stabilization system protein ParE
LKPVRFSPRAAEDLGEIGDRIAADSPRHALTFVAEGRSHPDQRVIHGARDLPQVLRGG